MRLVIKPPPGDLVFEGAPVAKIQKAPDGRFFIARDGAPTVLVEAEELRKLHAS